MSVLDRTTTILWKYFSDKGFQVISADSELPFENTIAFVLSIPKDKKSVISGVELEDLISDNIYIPKLRLKFERVDLMRFEIRDKDILLSILIRFKQAG
jgi:hypothetical protein